MGRARGLTQTRIQSRRSLRSSAAGSGPVLGSKNLSILLCVVLAAATVALYSPVSGYSFVVLDDRDYVTANSHIHAGLAWSTVKWAFTTFAAANWHPLTWLSHAFDYQLFALNPAGHHLHSVLLHAFNAVVLFLLLGWMTKRPWPSLLVAALFAVHPLNVESVAWVAERKSVLSTFFFFAAIAAYGWYARKPNWRRYLLVVGLFAAGLMAKPMVITLPFVLMLLDYWPLDRVRMRSAPAAEGVAQFSPLRLVLEKIPLLVLSVASAVVTVKAQHAGLAVRSLHQFPLGIRIENAIVSYVLYLAKMLWPAHLALYPLSAIAIPAWQWILSASILIGITALAAAFHRKRYLLVGWLWFLGTLVPVIGLVQVGDATMADRYAYIPLIGIFIIVAWGIADLLDRREIRFAWRFVAALCVVIALGAVTTRQMSYWNNEIDLWSRALAVNEDNPFAHDALGAVLMDPDMAMPRPGQDDFGTGEIRMEKARRHLELALAERRQLAQANPATYLPDMAVTLNNLGNLERMENNAEKARQYYRQAVEIHSRLAQQNLDPYASDRAMALTNLGYLEASQHENDKALPHFENALAIYRQLAQENPDQYLPNLAEALNNVAVSERGEKQTDEARRDYEEALRIRRQLAEQNRDEYLPYVAMTLNDLAVLNQAANQPDDARQRYEEALKLYRQLAEQNPDLYVPFLARTLNNIGFLSANQNRPEESRAYYNEALSLYRRLLSADPDQYAVDVARVEAGLRELEEKSSARK